jgi:hypothetical protein
LREAVRRHLAAAATVEAKERPTSRSIKARGDVEEAPGSGYVNGNRKAQAKWTKGALERHLLDNAWPVRAAPGLIP